MRQTPPHRCRHTGSAERAEAVSKHGTPTSGRLEPKKAELLNNMTMMMLLKCCRWVLTATWPGQLHHASKSHAATLTNKRRRGRQIAGDLLARVAKQLKTGTGSLNQKVKNKVGLKCSVIVTLYLDELINII